MHFSNIRMTETDNFVCHSQSILKTIFSSSSFIKSFKNWNKFMDCWRRLNYFIHSISQHSSCHECVYKRSGRPGTPTLGRRRMDCCNESSPLLLVSRGPAVAIHSTFFLCGQSPMDTLSAAIFLAEIECLLRPNGRFLFVFSSLIHKCHG
ncbi:hypothetical protein CDAR_300101 [Caerostris darwini]|uniref:Uncharacterized protein n=1 Tax=Caerostris darwini TaxID=1538125 RepID=A0AAV4W4G5_9ARAC|nr:hypothetical protein CDAR_300101 [Caerostris darwini]